MLSLDLPFPLVDVIVDRALAEDLASGDITTEACIDADARTTAHGVARGPIVACGGPVVLIGYSFGAAVAAAITHPAVVGWALIAPALVVPQFVSPASPLRPPAQPAVAADHRPKLVVTAERDAWFGADVLDPLTAQWVACEQRTVPSADHFFAATTDEVAGLAVAWAVAHAASRPSVRR